MIVPEYVQALDACDPLASKRFEFSIPNGTIYMDGNSLGPLTAASRVAVNNLLENQWGSDLIQGWNKHQWIDMPSTVGEKIAPLVGSAAGQIICCDSISVNLFKLLACALKLNPNRSVVVSQDDNFPTDLYIAQGLSDLLGAHRCQLKLAKAENLFDYIDESVAVLMLTHVNFRSGDMHDMAELTRMAHAKGVLVIWDLAHSAGAVPLALDNCEVDFAVGCGYKFLNGGPGAPAFVYIAQRHHETALQPLNGWMGHASPFKFSPHYQAATGPRHFLSGTPSIIAMAALDAALEVFSGVDIDSLYAKSIALAEFFLQEIKKHAELQKLELISSPHAKRRGSQLAFTHPEAYAISQALIARGVIVDYREPNIVRFGITPLYQSFEDLWRASQVLNNVVASKEYQSPKFQQRNTVT